MAPKKKRSREDREFEVERIVGDKYVGGKRFFFIKWKNFSTSQNTWEPENNLSKCSSLIRDYFNGKGLRNSKSHNLSTALLRSLKASKQRRSSISSLISISSSKSCRQLTVSIKRVDVNVCQGDKLNANRHPRKSLESSDSPRVQLVRTILPGTMPKVSLESSDDVENTEYYPKGEGPNESNVHSHSLGPTRLSSGSNLSLRIQPSDESVNDHSLEDSRTSNLSLKCSELTMVLPRVSSRVLVDSKLVEASSDPTQTVSFVPEAEESGSKESNESETGDKTEQNFAPTNSNIDSIGRRSISVELEPNAKITVRLFDQTPRPVVFSAPPVLDENLDEIVDSDEDLLSMRRFENDYDDDEEAAKKSKKRKRKRY